MSWDEQCMVRTVVKALVSFESPSFAGTKPRIGYGRRMEWGKGLVMA